MGGQSANSTACAMTSPSVLAPLLELAQDKDVRQLLEVGRQLFTNSNITVNLLPALAALIGLILLLLFILPLFSEDSHSSSGYGAPSTGYDSPSSGYGAPASSYDAPSDSYGTRQYRSVKDDVGDYRSLVSSLKLSDGAVRSGEELSKAVADLVQPVVSRIGEAAGKLVQ